MSRKTESFLSAVLLAFLVAAAGVDYLWYHTMRLLERINKKPSLLIKV